MEGRGVKGRYRAWGMTLSSCGCRARRCFILSLTPKGPCSQLLYTLGYDGDTTQPIVRNGNAVARTRWMFFLLGVARGLRVCMENPACRGLHPARFACSRRFSLRES